LLPYALISHIAFAFIASLVIVGFAFRATRLANTVRSKMASKWALMLAGLGAGVTLLIGGVGGL